MELERIRSGDSEAFGHLLREAWVPLVRYLLTLLDSVETAEDAAQEAFVRLWEHRHRWESGSARAMVFRIGRNIALDVRRRAQVRRRWRRQPETFPKPSPVTPEEAYAGAEFQARFQAAMEGLPPRRREVFELIRFRGLSYQDVAELLEVSRPTVSTHMRLAVRDLRYALSDGPQAERAESPTDDHNGDRERSSDG